MNTLRLEEEIVRILKVVIRNTTNNTKIKVTIVE